MWHIIIISHYHSCCITLAYSTMYYMDMYRDYQKYTNWPLQ